MSIRIIFINRLFVCLFIIHSFVTSQFLPSNVNLGSFSLQQIPSTGDLRLGIGNGINIFGFGADRQFGLNLGPGRFDTQVDNGLLIGGRRIGVDSHVGYQQGGGIDLGSILNFFQPSGPQFLPNPFVSRYSLQTRKQYRSSKHGDVQLARNSEEMFPTSEGIGWEDEEHQKQKEHKSTNVDNTGGDSKMLRDDEQWEIRRTDEEKTKDERRKKLPILMGLEPLKLK